MDKKEEKISALSEHISKKINRKLKKEDTNMKSLRTKMIVIVFFSAAIIFAMTFFLVRGSFLYYFNRQADAMTLLISNYNGEVPELSEYNEEDFSEYARGYNAYVTISEESAFSTRYFVVMLDADWNITSVNLEHVAAVDSDTAAAMAVDVLERGKSVGYADYYRYRAVYNENDSVSVIFLDCEDNFTLREAVVLITGIVSIIFPILITLVFGFLSKRVMAPFEENSRRQKQFITDASHELKTPLAIISANASVLEYKTGESEWLSNITDQTKHMGELIDDLLTLARMEEYDTKMETAAVNISEIVKKDVNDFAEVFRQKNIDLSCDVAEDVVINGNAKQLAMLISILMENASKYTTPGGEVKISLSASSKNAVFKIYNTAQLEKDLNVNKLFDRFYRPDSSRNSTTGGQGIGLSTALKIASLHGGSVTAKRVDEGICFCASLSLKTKK